MLWVPLQINSFSEANQFKNTSGRCGSLIFLLNVFSFNLTLVLQREVYDQLMTLIYTYPVGNKFAYDQWLIGYFSHCEIKLSFQRTSSFRKWGLNIQQKRLFTLVFVICYTWLYRRFNSIYYDNTLSISAKVDKEIFSDIQKCWGVILRCSNSIKLSLSLH